MIMDATGYNQSEIIQVCCDIEGESMHRHPAGDPHTDCRELLLTGPYTCQSLDASCTDTEICGRTDEDFFDVANVTTHIATIRRQFDNRIPDNLARTVISHIAATTGLKKFNTGLRPRQIIYQDICAIGGATQSYDVRMFKQEDLIVDFVPLSLFDKLPLKLVSFSVWHQTEIASFADSH